MMAFSVAMTVSGFLGGAVGSALMVLKALQAMSNIIIIRFIWRFV
jgi:hypothetical protein